MDAFADIVAREQIKSVRDELRQINHRVDNLAEGAIEKIKGDTKLAAKVEQLQSLISSLDEIVVRGIGNDPSMRAEVVSLRRELSAYRGELDEIKADLMQSGQHKTTLRVAEIQSKDRRWTTVATFITAVLGLIVAIATAYYK